MYIGEWSNDLRHGQGSTSKIDSNEILVSPYVNDKKHGYGYRMVGNSKVECVFYNDTEVVTED